MGIFEMGLDCALSLSDYASLCPSVSMTLYVVPIPLPSPVPVLSAECDSLFTKVQLLRVTFPFFFASALYCAIVRVPPCTPVLGLGTCSEGRPTRCPCRL